MACLGNGENGLVGVAVFIEIVLTVGGVLEICGGDFDGYGIGGVRLYFGG